MVIRFLALLTLAVRFALHKRPRPGSGDTSGAPAGKRTRTGNPVTPATAVKPAQQDTRNRLTAGTPPGSGRTRRGRPIPPGVQRLPSGKLPANYGYAGRKYDGDKWTAELARKYPNGVTFTHDGFPDFSPYATHTVDIPNFKGDRTDFTQANKLAGLKETPEGYIWHHHQNTRTMQLVPEDLHDGVRHAGGVAIMKGRK